MLYSNPPFSKNVKIKLGKEFLKLVKVYFLKNNTLNKIFNKNTIKLSYSCLPNMKSFINAQNKQILNESNNEPKLCNCKKNTIFPFNKKCLLKGVFTKQQNFETKEYIGSTGVSFKTIFNQHMHILTPITVHKSLCLNTSKNPRMKRMWKYNGLFCTVLTTMCHSNQKVVLSCNLKRLAPLPKQTEKRLSIQEMN